MQLQINANVIQMDIGKKIIQIYVRNAITHAKLALLKLIHPASLAKVLIIDKRYQHLVYAKVGIIKITNNVKFAIIHVHNVVKFQIIALVVY